MANNDLPYGATFGKGRREVVKAAAAKAAAKTAAADKRNTPALPQPSVSTSPAQTVTTTHVVPDGPTH